jgi:hypothetical protein
MIGLTVGGHGFPIAILIVLITLFHIILRDIG